jgi:hypothetical protein
MRDIKIEVMFWVHKQDFTKEIARHYTTVERLTSGKDKFKYSQVDIIARRQYTGLKDKNGVEIYEGDIFEDDEPGYYLYASWNNETSRWTLIDTVNGSYAFDFADIDMSMCNVAGNIHQNPELLGN